WQLDSLDELQQVLSDLTYIADAHHFGLPLAEFERSPRDAVAFQVLDRVQNPALLPDEISHHVLPLLERLGQQPDEFFLTYVRMCAEAIIVQRQGSGDLTTEQRAVAIVRCMSHSPCNLKAQAVLSLVRAVSFPFSEELWMLVQEAITWEGSLKEELQEAERILRLSQIVQRYRVTNFVLVNPSHATNLVEYIAAQVQCPTALEDALQVAAAYSHLREKQVYIDYLQNLS
ncbi:unnamed protein product, partial [Chrysoparadoxa australica]